MNHSEVFGNAKWIGFNENIRTPLVRASFKAPKTVSAEITICGLGYFELYLNGKRISEDLFVPVTSDYCHRNITVDGRPFDEHFRHRCYCLKYDLSKVIQPGLNQIGVALGPGFFGQEIEHYDSDVKFGDVRLCYRIILTDIEGNTSEVVSGEDAKWKQSEIIYTNLFEGETHDLTLCSQNWLQESTDDWCNVIILPNLETNFLLQNCPGDYIERTIVPTKLSSDSHGTLYDAGENITGWVILKDCSKEKEEVIVTFGESLDDSGHLDLYFSHNQKWNIISDGNQRNIHPKFTWFGFRYFLVEGNAEVCCVAVIHSKIAVNSAFKSANSVLDWFYHAYVRTQLNNFHGGIPSDCPHIERRGYTGDGQLTCESAMLMTDCHSFIRKWMVDISDCQDLKTGHVQYTAPYTRCGGGPGGWGIAIITVPLVYYYQTADKQPLNNMYDGMVRYLDYLEAHSENHLVTSDREGQWCLGDWCTPAEIEIPCEFVNTYFKVKALDAITEIEAILEKPRNPEWELRRKDACNAIIQTYYNCDTHDFANGIQGANAFALDIGLGDAVTLSHFLNHYETLESYDTGIFGTEIVTRLLGKKGRYDLEYRLLTSTKPNTYGSMMKTGATTLWEYWSDYSYQRSLDHPMFGAASKHLFYDALGIGQEEHSAGWKNVIIEPKFMKWLPQAEGFIQTPFGKLSVAYERKLLTTEITIEVPTGMHAEFIRGNQHILLCNGVNHFTIEEGIESF